MTKIKFASGTELEIVNYGFADNKITFNFYSKDDATLSDYENIFSSKENTSKIALLNESEEEFMIYSNFTKLIYISKSEGVITIVLERPDEITMRLESLESQMTDTQMALCEIYEGMVL